MLNYDATRDNSRYTATIAVGFFIANLLFIGVFYIALWVLYFMNHKTLTPLVCRYLKQSLIASTLSLGIFLLINIIILMTSGYASLGALIGLEIYFMLVVPAFLLVGIIAFVHAVKHEDYSFPVIRGIVCCESAK